MSRGIQERVKAEWLVSQSSRIKQQIKVAFLIPPYHLSGVAPSLLDRLLVQWTKTHGCQPSIYRLFFKLCLIMTCNAV